jgi:hypothetical protein
VGFNIFVVDLHLLFLPNRIELRIGFSEKYAAGSCKIVERQTQICTTTSASAAVVTGLSADQVRAPDGTRKCIDAIDAAWRPRVPILFTNGVLDPVLTPELAHARRDGTEDFSSPGNGIPPTTVPALAGRRRVGMLR